MKKENMEIILFGICIILFILGITSMDNYYQDKKFKQEFHEFEDYVETIRDSDGEYNYCVEWDNYIDRHSLDYECDASSELPMRCRYKILDNNKLEVTIYNMSKDITDMVIDQLYYDCTQWVKSRR